MKSYNGIDVTKLNADEVNTLVVEIGKQGKFAGIIYCYTNQVNGKRYVGQTTRPHTRHIQHINASNDGSVFHRVVQRYGANLFTYSILEFFISDSKAELQSMLNDSEISYIESYQSLVKQHGYNVAPGGTYNGSGEIAKAVDMYSMTGEFIESFDSISDANRKFGFSGPTIRQVCNHNHYTAGGYLWAWKDMQPLIPEEKCVCAYDLEGKFIARFNNAFEASKILGFKAVGGITNALKDKHRIAHKMYWRDYQADEIPMEDFPKAVFAYDSNGKFVAWYKNYQEAVLKLNLDASTGISHAIKKKHIYSGYYWRGDYVPQIDILENQRVLWKPIKAVFPNGEIKYYQRIIDAAYYLDVNTSGIHRSINKHGKTKDGIRFYRLEGDELNDVHFEDRLDIGQREKKEHIYEVKVDKYTLYGEYLCTYNTVNEIKKEPGFSNVSAAINNQRYHCNGYLFCKHGEVIPQEIFDKYLNRRIFQYSVKGDYIAEFHDDLAAANAVNGDRSRIRLCAQPPYSNIAYGYRWSNKKLDKLQSKAACLPVKVYAYNDKGEFVKGFDNMVEAAKAIGKKCASHLKVCTQEHWRRAGGYYWRREKFDRIEIPLIASNRGPQHTIIQL